MAKKRYVPGIGKRAFTKAERASYRAGFKAGVKFAKVRAKGDLRKHAKREGWY